VVRRKWRPEPPCPGNCAGNGRLNHRETDFGLDPLRQARSFHLISPVASPERQKLSKSENNPVKNQEDKVLGPIPPDEAERFHQFLDDHDFCRNSRRAFTQDIRKFASWFTQTNKERFHVGRITTRDIGDFKDFLRREQGQAVATVNRCLVTLRRYLGWLVQQNVISGNPAQAVKELRRQQLAPKGLQRAEVRLLLREVELRQDIRAAAIFSLLLYTGARVGDVVNLEIPDLTLTERSGTVIFRFGKGDKQRRVPLPLLARKALLAYLESRPPVESSNVFVGERGPLTERGIRALCAKYSALIGVHLHPHLFRHSFAHQFLADNGNDLVALPQLLGHESLNTTSRYCKQTQEQLAEASERLNY
jgi:site-specific recombinase XerD